MCTQILDILLVYMKNTAVKQFFRDDVYSRAFLRMARYATVDIIIWLVQRG